MQSAAASTMAISMLVGASAGRLPESWAKNAANGTLIPMYCSAPAEANRSEEHTSELQSLMRNSYAVFCLKKKKQIIAKNKNIATNELTKQNRTKKNTGYKKGIERQQI